MINLLAPEMQCHIVGGMCNCIGRATFVTSGDECSALPWRGNSGNFGLVTHAGVCKDMLGNMTLNECGGHWDFKFIGCPPQDDIGMQEYLKAIKTG